MALCGDDSAIMRRSGVLSQGPLAAYSVLSFALAMAMLPIYMIAPKYYSDTLGLDLGVLGLALFAVRLVDTVQDPLIGRLVDGLARWRAGWTILMVSGAVLLGTSFVLLFDVPAGLDQSDVLVWMVACLVLVYTAHSLMNVCYLTWGARLTDDLAGRARVTAWREASGVLGVVVASVLPALWVTQSGAEQAYTRFSWVFVAVLGVTLVITLTGTSRPIVSPPQRGVAGHRASSWRTAFGRAAAGPDRRLWRLYGFYLFNATATAIPATLILFYVEDVLEQPERTGLFLGAYFLAGLGTLAFWVRLSDRLGKAHAWAAGSLVAGTGLMLAAFLGEGDAGLYLLVCILTGSALGADLALPPAMLADAISPDQRSNTGLYFGVWALTAKFALAIAAGASLPLLGALDYVPGDPSTAGALAYLYALLPLFFKVIAAGFIGRSILNPSRSVMEA